MSISPDLQPIGDDDAVIETAVAQATIAALLPAVAHATGDLSLLRADLQPDPADLFDPMGGLSEEQQAEARRLAVEALVRFRDAGGQVAPPPDDEALARLMGFVVGESNVEEYFALLREELALDGDDRRAPAWTKEALAPDVPFTVGIVGAGMSGIAAAHRLGQAGVPYVIFEKNADVGGTWFENTYPGCRVDVPNLLYSYSFAPGTWNQHFSSQDELLAYFRRCSEELGVRDHVRFGTEVRRAAFDDDGACWTLQARGPDGVEETVEVQALISAVGQLNRPNYPVIEGLGTFAGPSFHSAEWDHGVDLAGKRVGVIGTGASAAEFIPHVAEAAGELVVFQRTPNWYVPTPDYHEDISEGIRWLFDHVPSYVNWYRLWLFWRMHEGLLPAAKVDPDWTEPGSISLLNFMIREVMIEHLRTEFAGAPELLERVIPAYPPIAKRIIRDNGVWARTLMRDNTELVTDTIERITPEGVVTAGGVLHELDVLIYGTGFKASEFLMPMEVTGREGIDLHGTWAGDARAYLGVTVPGFPNLFCLYGPNTNIVINGSIIYFSECEVHYLTDAIRLLLETGHRALDVRKDTHDAFNERVDAANREMAWGAAEVNSWYKNSTGRVAQNWPFSLLEYWQLTRRIDPADYELL